jgi:hypothetical protein
MVLVLTHITFSIAQTLRTMEKSAVKGQTKGVINSRQIKVILYTNIFSSHFFMDVQFSLTLLYSHFRLSTTTLGIIRGLCQGWLFLDSLECELRQHTYQRFSLSFMWRHFSVLPLLNRSEIFITRIILSNCVCTWIRGNCQSRHHIWKGREETVEKWRGLCLSFLRSNQLDIKTTDPRDGPTRSMFLDHLISAFVFMLPFGS